MIKKVLGFDVSSTTIGYAVLAVDEKKQEIKFVSADYLKPIKKGTILERLADTRNKIKKIIEKIKPDYIAIEDIIMFIRGMSTANTVITLTSFNRMIGLLSLDFLGKSPNMYSVMAIRHGLKTTPDLPDKEEMPELAAKHLNINFPYELNKNGKLKIENYDKADAISVALMHAFVLLGKATDKQITYKKKKKKRSKKKK